MVALDEPGHVLEYELPPVGELGGIIDKDRFFGAVEDCHFQPIGCDFDIDWFLVLFLNVEDTMEITGDCFEECLIFDVPLVVQGGVFLSCLDFFLHDPPCGGGGFSSGCWILEVE